MEEAEFKNAIHNYFATHPHLSLEEAESTVKQVYNAMRISKIGVYHPVDVEPLEVNRDSYNAQYHHEDAGTIEDTQLVDN